MSKEVETHAMTTGGFSPYHEGHHLVVKQMIKDKNDSVNVFATQSGRRPIPAEKKVDYIKTAVGKGVNVGTTQTPFHAAAQLHKEGKRGKLVVYGGSDRAEIADRLRSYNGKEGKHGYYNFEGGIEFRQVGAERKKDAKGIASFSGTDARKSKNPEELKKFLPKELHPRAKEIFKDLQEETMNPIGIFLLGGPGSGKDYVLKNIFSRFDLTEVQADQIINGVASELLESKKHIVINGANDASKIEIIQSILEGYTFDFVHVSVTNKVSRLRNELRDEPIAENKRIDKFLKAEQLAENIEAFVFNNSINLNESSDMEKVFFAAQIEKLLERVVELGLEIQPTTQIKTFVPLKEKVYMPAKYKTGNEKTDAARASHWKKMSKYSDRDPRAYKDAPGDKKARKEGMPLSPHTIAVRNMMAKEEAAVEPKVRRVARTGNVTAVMNARKETGRIDEGQADKSLAAKASKSGISVSTLRKVYRRGVAAWNSGHRPGTTPSQWGHARVNSYINKGKTYHTADKDLHSEETKITGTNCKNCIWWCAKSEQNVDKAELNENGGLIPPNKSYIEMAKHVDLVTLPGKATVKIKALCEHEEIHDFVTERMCCAYWDGEGVKRDFKGEADVMSEDIDSLFEMQLDGTDEYRKHAIAMTPGQNQEIENALKPIKKTDKKETEIREEETDCCSGQLREGTPRNLRDFRKLRAEAKTSEQDSTINTDPKLQKNTETRRKVSKQTRNYNATMDGLPVVAGALAETKKSDGFMPTPRQVPAPPGGHPVPAGYERVKSWGGAWELRKIKEKPTTVKEAVEYHIENQISFTDNVFRPGSEMFFEMISEAKRLYKEGKYTPADEFELDMLNSDIGEKVMFEGQEVILDYPFEEIEQIDETLDTVYPHKYHGSIGPSDTGDHVYSFYVPEKGTSRRHTYSVSITNGPGKPGSKTGNLSFDYNGRKPKSFSPIKGDDIEYLRMHTGGDVGVTGKGGGKASSIISTVKAIAQKHAKEHGLSNIEFGANWLEPSRTKLYDRITSRLGGKNMGIEDEDSPYVKYSVPVKEDSDPTKGKGIGKPWREGGGGAVYVRDGGSIRKVRFSQSGMAKKYMDPARVRSFVARHHCLTNKDKTSASYWACRWPRFFSNSGKTWW